MARKKKDGRRKPGSGIQGKGGSLYILVSQYVIENGIRIRKRKWIPTRLPDKPENIKLAMEMRDKLLHNGNPTLVETNISLADYIDTVLEAKKREISDTTYANYSYQAKRTKKHFGNIKIRDIHKEDIEAFLDSLLEKTVYSPEQQRILRLS